MGGPPLVSPNRVKVGGSLGNDDKNKRDTWLIVMTPRPGGGEQDRVNLLLSLEFIL